MSMKFLTTRSKEPTCKRCSHLFTEEEVENGEVGVVKKGPAKGRTRITVFCPKCHQRNIIIKAKKATNEEE